jgi:hypothetical protein
VSTDLAAEAPPCGGCEAEPSRHTPVSWSPAFGQYLCALCRARYTDNELHATERANAAARLAAAVSAKGASAP